MNQILQLDTDISLWINRTIANGFFDYLLPWLRNKYVWMPLYVFVITWFFVEFKKKGFFLLIAAIFVVFSADQISAKLMKPTFKRERPCNNVDLVDHVIVRAPCRGSFSFVSSHATNHFALGTFFSLLFGLVSRRHYGLFFVWASLISISQVYVGLHYFFDVLVGGGIGVLIGMLVFIMSSALLRMNSITETN